MTEEQIIQMQEEQENETNSWNETLQDHDFEVQPWEETDDNN